MAATTLCATSAMAARDDFDRASLGNRWVVTSGSLFITSDQMQGSSLSLGYFKKSANDTTVSATITDNNAAEIEYGAVASGDIAGGNNAFVKLQSQNGLGSFDTAGFYTGNNGGGDFFTLAFPVPSPARLTVTFCGTVATMRITSSGGRQVYTFDYGTSFGTGGGLGTYGSVSLDDYASRAGGCKTDSDAIVIKSSNATDKSLSK